MIMLLGICLRNIFLPQSYKDILPYFIVKVSAFHSDVFNLFGGDFGLWHNDRGPVSSFTCLHTRFSSTVDEFFPLACDLQGHIAAFILTNIV